MTSNSKSHYNERETKPLCPDIENNWWTLLSGEQTFWTCLTHKFTRKASTSLSPLVNRNPLSVPDRSVDMAESRAEDESHATFGFLKSQQICNHNSHWDELIKKGICTISISNHLKSDRNYYETVSMGLSYKRTVYSYIST